MEGHTFDLITRRFAGRQFSRRVVGRAGGGALAGQDATASPMVSPAANPATSAGATEFLFVQNFSGATLETKVGEVGVYTLTLTGGMGYTLYFSDRPERVTGTVNTAAFLKDLGFSPQNPPNAALVVQTNESRTDNEDILVVELLNPGYDAATGTVTYDVRFLGDYSIIDMRFSAPPLPAPTAPQTYGVNSLFIDDWRCGDHDVLCYTSDCTEVGELGGNPKGFCWYYGTDVGYCVPCDGWDHFIDECDRTVAACNGQCQAARRDECTPYP